MNRIFITLAAALCVLLAGCLDDEARGIAWAPDGSALAWVQNNQLHIQPMTEGLRSGDAVEVSVVPVGDAVAWLPDSSGVVAVATSDENWQLVKVTVDGTQTTLVSDAARLASPLADPGGRLMIHAAFDWEGADIFGWLDGARPTLVSGAGDQIPLGLSADGRYLLHTSCVNGQTDLWVYDFEIGVGSRLTDDAAVETMARWLPGSRSVIYATQEGRRGAVWLTEIADPDPDRLWRGNAIVTDIEWMPSGDEIMICAGGELHRVNDRGRDHRVWSGIGTPIHDFAISPDGSQIALALGDRPLMLAIDWGYPWPIDGDFETSLDLMGKWATRVDEETAMAAFARWLARTEDSECTAQILKQRAEVLIDQGDTERALTTLSLALRAHTPADPELHRMVGEILDMDREDSQRALVVLRNYQAERVQRRDSNTPPTPPLMLQVLETESDHLIGLHRHMVRAAESEHWAEMVAALSALLDASPNLASGLMDFAHDHLEAMAMEGDLAALDLGTILLVHTADSDKRWEIQTNMFAALLRSEMWQEAPSAIAAVLSEDASAERLELLISESANSVLKEALGEDDAPTLFGDHAAERVAEVWRASEMQRVCAEYGTARDRMSVEGLIALALFVDGDGEGLSLSVQRVARHRSLESIGNDEAVVLTCVIHFLLGYQHLRDGNAAASIGVFERALEELNGVAALDLGDEYLEALGSLGLMAIEELATLQEVSENRRAVRAMRDDWRLLCLSLLNPTLSTSLPSVATPRRELPDLEEGTGALALDLQRERTRTAERAESTAVRDHAQIGQAMAMLSAGDSQGAVSVLRQVADGAEAGIHRRTALWHLMRIQMALGDNALAQEAVNRWRGDTPSEREWLIFQQWGDGHELPH